MQQAAFVHKHSGCCSFYNVDHMVTMGPLWLTVMELLMALVEVGAEAAILLCIKLVNEDHLPLVLALYSTVFINVVNVQLIFWRYYYYRRWFIVHLACTLVGLAIDVLELIAIGNIFVTPGIDYIPLPSTVFILLIHMMDVALHEGLFIAYLLYISPLESNI